METVSNIEATADFFDSVAAMEDCAWRGDLSCVEGRRGMAEMKAVELGLPDTYVENVFTGIYRRLYATVSGNARRYAIFCDEDGMKDEVENLKRVAEARGGVAQVQLGRDIEGAYIALYEARFRSRVVELEWDALVNNKNMIENKMSEAAKFAFAAGLPAEDVKREFDNIYRMWFEGSIKNALEAAAGCNEQDLRRELWYAEKLVDMAKVPGKYSDERVKDVHTRLFFAYKTRALILAKAKNGYLMMGDIKNLKKVAAKVKMPQDELNKHITDVFETIREDMRRK